jgi:hypothetical protein
LGLREGGRPPPRPSPTNCVGEGDNCSCSLGGRSIATRGGPLPRRPFCSFLATAVDPSPNFGGGVVVAARDGRCDGVGSGASRFLSRRAGLAREAGAARRLPRNDRPSTVETRSNSPFPHAVCGGRAGDGGRPRSRATNRRSAERGTPHRRSVIPAEALFIPSSPKQLALHPSRHGIGGRPRGCFPAIKSHPGRRWLPRHS